MLAIWLIWWAFGTVYAVWAWRLEFDVTLGTLTFAIVLSALLGPLLGVAWHLSWYFEHNPVQLPTITLLKKRR